ncbi:MAG: 30S ribosomal protein S3 [Patescibacteria group bacterium]|nr:MAG: 30S ribosomal protein S3 [Patescibacteria group bacterium]
MGQKVHPVAFRLGLSHSHKSRWFVHQRRYKEVLFEDVTLRKFLHEKYKTAQLARVDIERTVSKLVIGLYVARPGVVIGRGGSGLEELKKNVMKLLKIKEERNLEVKIEEVRAPDLVAHLVAQSCADQLMRRIPSKRVLTQTVDRVMRSGAKGVRVLLSGRVNGAEIARKESLKQGTIPLHTLRADIDFAHVPALTKSGYVGVKVWINRGVN